MVYLPPSERENFLLRTYSSIHHFTIENLDLRLEYDDVRPQIKTSSGKLKFLLLVLVTISRTN